MYLCECPTHVEFANIQLPRLLGPANLSSLILSAVLILTHKQRLPIQRCLFGTTALVPKKVVLILGCPYSEVPLQPERSDWSPMALSLHKKRP